MDQAGLKQRLDELGHAPATSADGLPLVAPASAEQAADLLGTCTREGWRVRLQGSGTRRPGAPGADLVVSARGLAGFDIYEPDDLTVGALAGTTCHEAAAELKRHRQLLALDLPPARNATLGGAFASGQAGPLRAGYGTPRDLALGVTLVTGDGRVLRLGGQVVKNVAGYDLVRLVVGSRGTLGLIVQLHARLRSLPASDVTMVVETDGGAAAAAAALQLRDAVAPVALELLAPQGPKGPWSLALRLHGSADVTADAAASVRRALPAARALEPAASEEFWQDLAGGEAAATVRVRCTVLPSDLPVLLEAASHLLDPRSENELGSWTGAAHATEGMLRLWTLAPATTLGERTAEALAELGRKVGTVNGTCICERGPASFRALLPGPVPAPRVLQLERELRQRFDPGAILAGD